MSRGDGDESLLIDHSEGGDRVGSAYGTATVEKKKASSYVTPPVPPGRKSSYSWMSLALVAAVFGVVALSASYLMVDTVRYILQASDHGDGPYTLVAACKLTKERRPMYQVALTSW